MAFRDDLTAAQARADALERELSDAEKENQELRRKLEGGGESGGEPGPRSNPLPKRLAMLAFVIAAAVAAAALATELVVLVPLVVALVFVGTTLLVADHLIVVVAPNQIAVVSGRLSRLPDGTTVGYRVVCGGRVVRVPFLETLDYLDASVHGFEGEVRGAYAKGGVPVNARFRGTIKVSSDSRALHNAVERFLGRSADEMIRVAREVLEGGLRAVLASHQVDELRGDPLRAAAALLEEVDDDMTKLGLVLDRLTIESIELAI